MFPDPATEKEKIKKSFPFLLLDRKALTVLALDQVEKLGMQIPPSSEMLS